MSFRTIAALTIVSLVSVFHGSAQPYATSVIGYTPGTGAAGSLNNPQAALGEPSRITPGTFGGPVDPFSPPYLASQLVSIGAGGSLTVQFQTPLTHDPARPYGIDFLIFGNTGFIVTNEYDSSFNVIGTPATDGFLFGQNTGATRVSVSEDGLQFYALNPSLAPVVDGFFPTDGAGDFQRAVNPALQSADFAGATLEQVRSLFGGSGGGTGYNLAWAQDTAGQPVSLNTARYVRVDALSGKSEIDAFVAVPEPGVLALVSVGLVGLALRRSRNRRS